MILKIFDVHAHVFSDGLARRMTDGIVDFYRDFRLAPHGTGTLGDCVHQMDSAGTAKFALSQVAMRPRASADINALMLSARDRFPDRVVPFAAIHPEQKDPEAYVAEAKAAGFRGFKIHPDLQRFPLDAEAAMPMLRAIEASGLPVLIHCGDPRFDLDGPRRVAALHERLPGLKAINAHFGGWSQLEEAVRILAGHSLTVDLSGTLDSLPPERAADIIRAFGTRNVIYGSDYPMYSPSAALRRFLQLPLSEDERADILWNNADRLIGLG